MALMESKELPVGEEAPFFNLPDTEGNLINIKDIQGENGIFVAFICNHCPYVKHMADSLSVVGQKLKDLKIGVVAISSNDATNYPDDSPEKMKEEKKLRGYPFPYLYDESQEVAKSYGAVCTPDLFLFGTDGRLFYHGQYDDSRPGKGVANGEDLLKAAHILADGGKQLGFQAKPSIGCSIKWK